MDKKALFLLPFLITPSLSAQNSSLISEPDSLEEAFGDPFNLNQVVVTATRTQKKLKNTPVITSRQIEECGVSDIKELLSQEVPGLPPR